MRDRREELGLDPYGLRMRSCPACGGLQDIRTELEPDGTRRYFCDGCGGSLGAEAAGSFDPPGDNFSDD